MTISIEDLGDRRRLSVEGTQWDGRDHRHSRQSVETILSVATLQELLRINGEQWVVNDVRRTELTDYIERPLRAMIEGFRPPGDPPVVLDFGCGTGSSTVILARAGFRAVGIDADPSLLNAARMRVADYGLSDLASFVETDGTSDPPFEPGSFDAVVASGVFEHIPPAERRQFARVCWKMLRPGGILYAVGSPNRLWPLEFHTSNMPLVHWLPVSLAAPIVRKFSKRVDRDVDARRLVDLGFVGVNLVSMLRWLPGAELLRASGSNVDFYFLNVMNPQKGRRLRRVLFRAVNIAYRAAEIPLRLVRLPVEAFFPYMYIAVRKG